ncbi:hypothetical protein EL84_05505 [Paenibacillus sp. VT-400]|uniref:DUF4928 family protein n=1 Tax=Paenibacillus sp. VT-400 TaxID=1495853 RepID=UPI00064A9B07|nr:DUF4928 family protein [Paenibacillus sp. VT-400]KLU57922.1 hypothetical protein EL84_05505 [Paenibacillus sp. VT-400]
MTIHEELSRRLFEFREQNKLTTKGKLAAILITTRKAKIDNLPLDFSIMRTDNKGQIKGLSKSNVQAILKEYGIVRVLAEEAGRTSRGSIGYVEEYVNFLNLINQENIMDLDFVERWWVDRIMDFFTAQPFVLKYDTSKSLRTIVKDLLSQAVKRQKDNPGTMYAGAVLQHLVGAKLSLILSDELVSRHGFSVSDSGSGRSGDFLIDEVVIHVTTAPSEALLRKCLRNLEAGYKPIIITTYENMAGAESLAKIQGIDGRIDILEAEQFIATNLYELSNFLTSERKVTVERLIEKYNQIVAQVETDPSIKISVG